MLNDLGRGVGRAKSRTRVRRLKRMPVSYPFINPRLIVVSKDTFYIPFEHPGKNKIKKSV